MFSDANSVYINNKEVKRIVSGDGGILYEKFDYVLNVEASPSIINIGETSVLTATLTYGNEPVEGETVVFASEEKQGSSTVVSSSGTYDFGDKFNIYLTNVSQLVIGDDNTNYIVIYSRPNTLHEILFYENGRLNDPCQYEIGTINVNGDVIRVFNTSDVEVYDIELDVDFTIWDIYPGDTATVSPVITPLLSAELSNGSYDVGDEYLLSDLDQNNNLNISIGTGTSIINIQGAYITSFLNQRPLIDDILDLSAEVIVKNNHITYTDSYGDEQTVDITGVDSSHLEVVLADSGVTLSAKQISQVTDSNGQANVGYVGKGTGGLNIQCSVQRILVNEIYIEDYY